MISRTGNIPLLLQLFLNLGSVDIAGHMRRSLGVPVFEKQWPGEASKGEVLSVFFTGDLVALSVERFFSVQGFLPL